MKMLAGSDGEARESAGKRYLFESVKISYTIPVVRFASFEYLDRRGEELLELLSTFPRRFVVVDVLDPTIVLLSLVPTSLP